MCLCVFTSKMFEFERKVVLQCIACIYFIGGVTIKSLG